MSVAKASLAAIVTLAGINAGANAVEKYNGCTHVLDHLDDESAARIVRVLYGSRSEGLNEILKARSFDELTSEQNEVLHEIIQLAASKLELSERTIT